MSGRDHVATTGRWVTSRPLGGSDDCGGPAEFGDEALPCMIPRERAGAARWVPGRPDGGSRLAQAPRIAAREGGSGTSRASKEGLCDPPGFRPPPSDCSTWPPATTRRLSQSRTTRMSTGPPNMQPPNISDAARPWPRQAPARGILPTSQSIVGPSTKKVNPTISIPSRSDRAWSIPSLIRTAHPGAECHHRPRRRQYGRRDGPPEREQCRRDEFRGNSLHCSILMKVTYEHYKEVPSPAPPPSRRPT